MKHSKIIFLVFLALGNTLSITQQAYAQHKLGSICTVKGQEAVKLHGMGLVVGLNGTGDNKLVPTLRSLAGFMEQMGYSIRGQQGSNFNLQELEKTKNAALVHIEVTIPPEGASEGDFFDCRVSAIGASSLQGGTLIMTPLVGPVPGSKAVYAIASGRISAEIDNPTTGVVKEGCRTEVDLKSPLLSPKGNVILILGKEHADFILTYEIAKQINSNSSLAAQEGEDGRAIELEEEEEAAKALDARTIQVRVPKHYATDTVSFIYELLQEKIYIDHSRNKITINKKTGVVIVPQNIEISPAAISVKGLNITISQNFLAVDLKAKTTELNTTQTENIKLKALVDSLNAIEAPVEDIIAVLEALKKNGSLYAVLEIVD
ncbi:MAG: flagellar basal body P-ring protein FlgI [Pirellulaceae bacterium]|nr:flagellar basal body P-ring protein FlgI [Pirellulaceae bacterium]